MHWILKKKFVFMKEEKKKRLIKNGIVVKFIMTTVIKIKLVYFIRIHTHTHTNPNRVCIRFGFEIPYSVILRTK